MPFSGVIDSKVALPTKTARAVAGILADSGSHDQAMHHNFVIKSECTDCGALPNERCAARRYPSGKVQQFARDFCPKRYAAAAVAVAEAEAEREETLARYEAEQAGEVEHDQRPHCDRHHWHMTTCPRCRRAADLEETSNAA